MTVFEAIMVALTFGILIVELIKLVIVIVKSMKK
ncbi:MAG: putative holin-like toxin [Defluviitaleaceae bacterium]|nr:putative holin-like toxin [Defluviitaleaceae bacterium]